MTPVDWTQRFQDLQDKQKKVDEGKKKTEPASAARLWPYKAHHFAC
jgi:hypothetical protein